MSSPTPDYPAPNSTLIVYRIDDLSVEFDYERATDIGDSDTCLRVRYDRNSTTTETMKRHVARSWDVPQTHLRFYGVTQHLGEFRFDPTEILLDDDDDDEPGDELLGGALFDLEARGLCVSTDWIGAMVVPARNDGDEGAAVDDLAAEYIAALRVSVIRSAVGTGDAAEYFAAAARACATMETGGAVEEDETDDDESGSDAEEDEDDEEEEETDGEESGSDVEEEDEDGNGPQRFRNRDRRSAIEEGAGPSPGPDSGAGGDAGAGPAAEVEGGPSEICAWLRGIDAGGSNTGRFEEYAPAFQDEFDSLEDLALSALNPQHGVDSIFTACGVERMGDKAKLEWAIGKLPRPR